MYLVQDQLSDATALKCIVKLIPSQTGMLSLVQNLKSWDSKSEWQIFLSIIHVFTAMYRNR